MQAVCRYSNVPVALKVYFKASVPSNVTHMVLRELAIHSGVEGQHANIIGLYAAFQVRACNVRG